MLPDVDHYDVLGTRIAVLTEERTIELLRREIDAGRRGYVCLCTVHEVVESRRDPELRAALAGASLTTPDGMPLVWWGRRVEGRPVSRVCGPDLLPALLGDPRHRRTRHYFFGGANPGITRGMVDALRREHPAAIVAGSSTPSFRPLDEDELQRAAEEIDRARPDIVWVGLGGRKQVLWMQAMRPRLAAPLLVGVGAAFDFLTGTKRRAPVWMRRVGLEWLFRLGCEPRRLWRRYVICNAIFLGHALRFRLQPGRYRAPS